MANEYFVSHRPKRKFNKVSGSIERKNQNLRKIEKQIVYYFKFVNLDYNFSLYNDTKIEDVFYKSRARIVNYLDVKGTVGCLKCS